MTTLLRYGVLATTSAMVEALALLEAAMGSLADVPEAVALPFVEMLAASIRGGLQAVLGRDERSRYKWELIDLVLAFVVGSVRFRLLTDPRGLEAIDDYDCREWLGINGAAEHSVNSAFVRGLYDLALAYEDGDPSRPRLAAGQGLRGTLRMFFSYRGALPGRCARAWATSCSRRSTRC